MHRRTYEILAKYIGKRNGIKIVFEPDVTPRADVKNKTIVLPGNIKEECAYEALSTLIHEAAHVRHTHIIPESFSATPLDHNITNVIEDVRIDNKNFGVLPNIKEFYRRYYVKYKEKRDKEDLSKVSLTNKVLINAIFNGTRFSEFGIRDKQVEDLDRRYGISRLVYEASYDIEARNWSRLRTRIEEIKKKLKLIEKQQPKPEQGEGKGKGDKGDKKEGMSSGGEEPEEAGTEKSGSGGSTGKDTIQVIGFKEGGDSWGTTNSGSTGSNELGTVALQELTKAKLKELLNIKEVRIITDGNKIDTDNLVSFFTGDIEELFKEERNEHKKCSKIMFVLDASSSMREHLLDGSDRKDTVIGATKEIIKVIEEVQSLEGLMVDWDICAFNSSYVALDKNNWEEKYQHTGGGTSIEEGFTGALNKMLNDHSIDGKRIIIMFSDGDVDECEISAIKKMIIRHGEDVRCVVIGVGSDINGEYSKEIIGDRNILAKESADIVIMESVMECL